MSRRRIGRGAALAALLLAASVARAEDVCGLSPTLSISAETRVEKDFLPIERVEWTGRYQEWSPWSFKLDWARRTARITFRYGGQDTIQDHRLVLVDHATHEAVYELLRCEGSPQNGPVRLIASNVLVDGQDRAEAMRKERFRDRTFEPSIYLHFHEGKLDKIWGFGAYAKMQLPTGGTDDVDVWMGLQNRQTPLNASSNRFRIQVRNAITETPEQRRDREAREKVENEQRAKAQAERDAEARKRAEIERRAEAERRAAAERKRGEAEAARQGFAARFEAEAERDFEPPPASVAPCSALAKLANPSRCERLAKARQTPGGGVRTSAATTERSASCPGDLELVTFSCRMNLPADHGVCRANYTSGEGSACLGSQSCCLSPRSRFRVMKLSKASCPIRQCDFVTAGTSEEEAELFCPSIDPTHQCTLGADKYPSLAHCKSQPAQVVAPPQLGSTVWSGNACRAFRAALDAEAAQSGPIHDQERARRMTEQADGRDLTCPHACTHANLFDERRAQIAGLVAALKANLPSVRRKRPRCVEPLTTAVSAGLGVVDHLAERVVGPIRAYRPPEDDFYGPYWDWGGPATNYAAYGLADFEAICNALDAYHACMQ